MGSDFGVQDINPWVYVVFGTVALAIYILAYFRKG